MNRHRVESDTKRNLRNAELFLTRIKSPGLLDVERLDFLPDPLEGVGQVGEERVAHC